MSRLAIEATKSITDVVEAMHRTIGSGPEILGRPMAGPTAVFTGPVYATIRGATKLVGAGIDVALEQLGQALSPVLGDGGAAAQRETVLAVLNGVLGDYLHDTANPLAIDMKLRSGGRRLELERDALRARFLGSRAGKAGPPDFARLRLAARSACEFPDAGAKLLVLVHGSCLNDLSWSRAGHEHGAALARDLGYTPVYLHYNTGLHVSTNGRAFSELLEELVSAWPAAIDELVILAHSMGGLVARSACRAGEIAGHEWRRKLSKMIFLGTPHHGAPLERYGNWVDVLLDVSPYSAPLGRLGRIRSAGVTDLRYGNVLDEHWASRDRFAFGRDSRAPLPLPAGVECYAIAATTASAPRAPLPGDGIVPVDSALGRHATSELTLSFAEARQWIGFGMGHLDLLDREEVYAKIRSWLSPEKVREERLD